MPGGYLRVRTGSALSLSPQCLEQHVRRSGQQHQELIGPELRAPRATPGQAHDPSPQQVADRMPDFLRGPAIDIGTGPLDRSDGGGH